MIQITIYFDFIFKPFFIYHSCGKYKYFMAAWLCFGFLVSTASQASLRKAISLITEHDRKEKP